MLVSESSNTQPVCPRALDNRRPFHGHRDVRMPDLLEWRTKIAMLRAHLNVSLKFIFQTPIIDRDNVAPLQFRCYVIDPIERRLIESVPLCGRLEGRLLRNWALHKDKLVILQINKFFHVAADQAHRHRVQQFVGKMNAQEWLQRVAPFHLIAKPFQRPRLPVLQDWKGLDYSVAQSCEEFWCAFLHRFENVARELPVVCALFDDDEIFHAAESLPHFSKLRGQKFPKQRAYADVREIIAFTSDCAAPRGIVSVLGMVECLLHEPGKRDRAVRTDGLTYQFGQHRIQSENVQRPTPNV